MRGALAAELGLAPDAVELDPGNPENVFIHYPSAFDEAGGYIASRLSSEGETPSSPTKLTPSAPM